MEGVSILDEVGIQQKVKRLAIQILENNFEEDEIILAGINNNGHEFARLIFDTMQDNGIVDTKVTLTNIRLSPANPLSEPITIGLPIETLKDKTIIVVDDVANTGRTLFYALHPVMNHVVPKRVEVAVLVDRKHKSFPIHVDYVGMDLATTFSEHIEVKIEPDGRKAVYLM